MAEYFYVRNKYLSYVDFEIYSKSLIRINQQMIT